MAGLSTKRQVTADSWKKHFQFPPSFPASLFLFPATKSISVRHTLKPKLQFHSLQLPGHLCIHTVNDSISGKLRKALKKWSHRRDLLLSPFTRQYIPAFFPPQRASGLTPCPQAYPGKKALSLRRHEASVKHSSPVPNEPSSQEAFTGARTQ